MAALSQVYVTMHGSYSGAWAGEHAQMGFRLGIFDVDTPPLRGRQVSIPSHGEVVPDGGETEGDNGTLGNTWTARLGGTGSPINANGGWQADIADDCYDFLTALKGWNCNLFSWTHVKLAPVGPDGAYAAPASTYTFTTPIVGSGTNVSPPELAIALSLRAPVVGRKGRGRLYFGGLSAGNDQTSTTNPVFDNAGRTNSKFSTAALAALSQLIANVENPRGQNFFIPAVLVTSAGSSTGVRPSEIRIGDHIDVQRRRQHQVPENYAVQALT